MSISFNNTSLKSPLSILKALSKDNNKSNSNINLTPGPGSYETSNFLKTKVDLNEYSALSGGTMGSQNRFKSYEKDYAEGNYNLLPSGGWKTRFPKVTSVRKNEFLISPGLYDSPGPVYKLQERELGKSTDEEKKKNMRKKRRLRQKKKSTIVIDDSDEEEDKFDKLAEFEFFLKKGKLDIFKVRSPKDRRNSVFEPSALEKNVVLDDKPPGKFNITLKTTVRNQSLSETPGPDHYFVDGHFTDLKNPLKKKNMFTFGTGLKTDFSNRSLGENIGPGRYNIQESSLSNIGTVFMKDYYEQDKATSNITPGPGSYSNRSLDLSFSKNGMKMGPVSINEMLRKKQGYERDRKPGPGAYSLSYKMSFPVLKPHIKSIKEKDRFRDFYEFKHNEVDGKKLGFGSSGERKTII